MKFIEKAEFRNSRCISNQNLRWKDKIPQPPVWCTVATVSCFGTILAFSKQPGTYRYIPKATELQWLLQTWLWQSDDKELYVYGITHIPGIFIFRMWCQNGVIWNFDTTEHPASCSAYPLWYSQYVQSPHGKATYHHTAVGVERYGGWYLDLQWTGDTTALHDTTGTY
jgi:hypothetical protein